MSNGIRFGEKALILDKIITSQLDKLQAIELFEFLIPEFALSALGRTQVDIDFSLILLTQIQKPLASENG